MKSKDLTGKRFGRLIVLSACRRERVEGGTRPRFYLYWDCVCDCGTRKECKGEALSSGIVKSCGCLKNLLGQRSVTHGLTETVEYRIWTGILTRCRNPHAKAFRLYGAAGISICDRWLDFANFLADMGARPSSRHSIDRIDNTGNYEPGNCRWATAKEQSNNQKRNVRLTFNGSTRTIHQWSEITGFKAGTIWTRSKAGWSIERTLTEVPKLGRRMARVR